MHEQISYLGFCTIGALNNPRLFSQVEYLGKYFMYHTYWYRTGELN